MIKVAIIDDEKDSVKSLELILTNYCPDAEIVGTAHSALDGIKLINAKKPDLVLLDIDMPHGSGFDLLDSLPERKFHVVFITAYNEFAIKAFKVNAIDYILKPVDIDELIGAVEKAAKLVSSNSIQIENYDSLLKAVKPTAIKIAISTSDGIEYINMEEIIYVDGEGSYSRLHLTNNTQLLVSKNLKELQELLEPKTFFRSHNSQVVNLQFVKKYNIKEGGYIELTNGVKVLLSRRKKDEFLEMMANFAQ